MLDILRSLRTLIKVSRIHTDGSVFRLHYSFTVIILMSFCIIITTKQYVGDPIDCQRSDAIEKNIINTFCWFDGTYTIPKAYGKRLGVEVPYPGIDNTTDKREFRYHRYYQWICFILFGQAALFYLPRCLWKLWEAGKIEAIVMHLDVGIGYEPDLSLKKQAVVDYLYLSRGHHDWYAARYYFCDFIRYGLDCYYYYMDPSNTDQNHNYYVETTASPMDKLFPRVTKCQFHKYGNSGGVELHDALCMLPLNIINEKIFLFMWIWFAFLIILTILMLLFGLLIIASPSLRIYMLNVRFKTSQLNDLLMIVRQASIGDWLLLYLIGKNMDSYILKDVIKELAQRYSNKDQRPMV